MIRILLYENRKQDPMAWDISTPQRKDRAFLALFKLLDEEWECYAEGTKEEMRLADKARCGDPRAAWRLLQDRRRYEYEEFKEITLEEP